MPIQIPFHSQASPARVPDAGGVRQPQGHWPTQQAVYTQTPQNREHARAEMFSGGLQGLQSVAQGLGDMGSGFYQIAQQMRKMDDFAIRSEAQIGMRNVANQVKQFQLENPHSPELWMPEAERITTEYSQEVLSRDMPQSLKAELQHQVAMQNAGIKYSVLEASTAHIRKRAVTGLMDSLDLLAMDGMTDSIRPVVEQAVATGLLDPDQAPKVIRSYEAQAQESNAWQHVSEDPFTALEAVQRGRYNLEPQQQLRMESAARTAINADRRDLYEKIAKDPSKVTDEDMQGWRDSGRITPEVYQQWKEAPTQGDLSEEEFHAAANAILDYDPANDRDNAGLSEKYYMLAMIKARGDDPSYDALSKLLSEQERSGTPAAVSFANDMIDNVIEAMPSSLIDDDTRLKRKHELKDKAKRYFKEANPNIDQMHDWIRKEVRSPSRAAGISQPLSSNTTKSMPRTRRTIIRPQVTHYWPGPKDEAANYGLSGTVEGGTKDAYGNTIWGKTTMEDYLAGNGDYVTVAMDKSSKLQKQYLKSPAYPGVVFRVMDNGGYGNNKKGEGWVDIAWKDPAKAKANMKRNISFVVIGEDEAKEIVASRNA